MSALRDLLKPSRLTHIVHVGASPVDDLNVYRAMLEEGLCHLTGFEPNPDALAVLNLRKGENQTFLPWIIGAHSPRTMHFCEQPSMNSLLEPDPLKLAAFERFGEWGSVKETVENLNVVPFDWVKEIHHCDFLVMDVQGAELEVLHSGEAKLANCAAVMTEVSWVPLYKDQPPFGVIDLLLRKNDFLPHCFASTKLWPLTTHGGILPANDPHQLLESDIVYVKDFTHTRHQVETLKQLAMLGHYVLGSIDLTMRCIRILEMRGALPDKSGDAYTKILETL